jgi:dipeptidyl aminopeptidase/acylaminoacyl peptidase
VGLLFYPPGYRAGQLYPLVIQSVYGSVPSEEFTLYGYQQDAGLGPTLIAPYPGRLLAARGILVLHMDVTMGTQFGTPTEPEVRQRAFEAAAQQLVQAGLVDQQRIGLLGFSRNGYYVEHTLAHSAFPFAAALSADNWDPSYMAYTLAGFGEPAVDIHGAGPFGAGLAKWIERAPGFNAERVRTPLLSIVQSTGILDVLLKWELFSRLRHLGKAVELYVMPDAMYGAHCTQNPRQILAVQQRSIDWFDFWLNGRENADESKARQYERWRVLRDQAQKDQGSRGAYVPR